MPPSARAAVLLSALLLSGVAAAQQSELRKELAPLEERERGLDELLQHSPEKFITESVALATAYHNAGKRHAKVSQSVGARGQAVTILRRAAFVACYQLRQPAKAIDLYRRAATLHAEQYPAMRNVGFGEEIADIQQFHLGDHAAAATTLEQVRKFHAAHANSNDELAHWAAWKSKWLDAEIAYLRTRKRFTGNVDAAAVTVSSRSSITAWAL